MLSSRILLFDNASLDALLNTVHMYIYELCFAFIAYAFVIPVYALHLWGK